MILTKLLTTPEISELVKFLSNFTDSKFTCGFRMSGLETLHLSEISGDSVVPRQCVDLRISVEVCGDKFLIKQVYGYMV